MRKNNRATRAARIVVEFFSRIFHSPFAACSVNSKGCEEEAIITVTAMFSLPLQSLLRKLLSHAVQRRES